MAEPMFSETERVQQPPTGGTEPQLPKELVGKTPGQIAQYYQQREQQIIKTAREAIAQNDPTKVGEQPPKRGSVTMEHSTEQPGAGELDAARTTLRETAKRTAAQGKKYWPRFEQQIEAAIKQMGPDAQVNFQFWEAMYYNLLGQNKDAIESEEREAAAAAARQASERPSPGAETPPPLTPLHPLVTGKILPGLQISEQTYRDGEAAITAGRFPFTYDSRQGRTK